MSDVRFAVVGAGAVGGYYAARLAHAGLDVGLVARGTHLAAIKARGLWIWSPLGDLVVHPIDAAGRAVAPDLGERAIAIDLDDLRRVRRVVAVAAGSGKGAAIRGALASGIVRILATDATTARRVMNAG